MNTEISGVFLFGGVVVGEIGVNKECTYPDRSQQLNIERGAERRAACWEFLRQRLLANAASMSFQEQPALAFSNLSVFIEIPQKITYELFMKLWMFSGFN